MISKMSIISIYVGGDAQHDLQPQLRHRLTNLGNLILLIEYELPQHYCETNFLD